MEVTMAFRVSGRNLEIGEAMQERISERVRGATAKYFDGGFSGHATVGKDGFGYLTECVVHLDSGVTLEAEGMSADAYDSADQAANNIEKRLRRYKRKRTDHRDGRDKRTVD
ncbi:MAG: ribosome hibernation-promoting factor, HPF/YfiA family [Pseudolabrys sp.]